MKSIPTIFIWDKVTREVVNKPLRMVDWVFQGKGTATRKYDGIAIKVEKGKPFRRFEWHTGEKVPAGFIKLQDPDPRRPLAAIPGWVPISDTFLTKPVGADEKALKEAWNWLLADMSQIEFNNSKQESDVLNRYIPTTTKVSGKTIPDGTYELCGPKVRGNHDGFKGHVLLRHGADVVKGVPRTFEGLKKFLEEFDGEGIVWHYNTGGVVQMAKIKRRDFGFHTRVSKEDVAMAYRAEEKVEEANGVAACATADCSSDDRNP